MRCHSTIGGRRQTLRELNATAMAVIVVQHSEPQHFGQERVDPLDWVEPAQHRNERREESLTDTTMVPKYRALRAPSLARTYHDLPAFCVVAVLQGTSSDRGGWPPSAEDSGAREE